MDLSLSEDQRQVLDALDAMARPHVAAREHGPRFWAGCDALDAQLAASGFLDVAAMAELGAETAALVVESLARLPFALEAGASALIRPLLDAALPRPLCVAQEGAVHRPLRYLRPGASVVVVGAHSVTSFTAQAADIRPAGDALYAYPMAFLTALPPVSERRAHAATPAQIRTRWRIALAAEAAGLLAGALASTVTHVSERHQFGRPLASFQALRHRLAEGQVVTNGARWLATKAAATDDAADAALAAHQAMEAAKRVSYDCHQFLGAMGMTLEHPLHLWTYRLKALTSELGGRTAHAAAAADALWGEA